MSTTKNLLNATPKTLNEAIRNGLRDYTVMPEIIEDHIRDFLSQKFNTTLLKTEDPNEVQRIWDLWKAITGRDRE